MSDLEVRRLRAFLAVARCGTFTAAVDDLAASQPVVSRRIAALEKTLSVQLLERTTHSVALTPAGEALAQQAGPALETLDAAAELARRAAQPNPALFLSVKPDGDGGVLARLLELCADEPDCPCRALSPAAGRARPVGAHRSRRRRHHRRQLRRHRPRSRRAMRRRAGRGDLRWPRARNW